MNYVESFDLFGVNAKQIPTVTGEGMPTTETEGAVGCLYMDTTNGDLYKCTAVTDGVYTWELQGSGGITEIEDGSITPEKTNFAQVKRVGASANLFDPETMLEKGVCYSYADYSKKPNRQTTSAYAAYGAVEISVEGLEQITISGTTLSGGTTYLYSYSFLDAPYNDGGTYVSYKTGGYISVKSGLTLDVPSDAKYILITVQSYFTSDGASNTKLMVNKGNAALPYEEFGWVEGIVIPNLIFENEEGDSDVEVEDTREMRLCLPEKYDLVVGDTFEMFFKGLMLCKDPYQYNILVKCDIGKAYNRKYIVTPTETNLGEHTLKLTISDDFGNVLAEQTTTLNVVNKATSPAENMNVLCVGDSLTEGGAWVDEVYRRLTKTTDKTQHNATAPVGDGLSNITFVGKKTTENGAGYEGKGGWKYDYYVDPEKSGNPFVYNGAVDFNAYCTDLGIDHIDRCHILLSWNLAWEKESNYKKLAKQFIDLLLAHNPSMQIVLIGVQMPCYDGLGKDYGLSDIWGDYRRLQEFVMNLDEWHKDIASEYPNNVTSINISGQFDTENSGQTREVAVNARSTKKVTEQSNGIHPDTVGYYQIADAVYRKFMADIQGG